MPNFIMMTRCHKRYVLHKHAFRLVYTYVRCQSTYSTIYCWMPHFAKTLNMPDSKRAIIESFWEGVLKEIQEDAQQDSRSPVMRRCDECADPVTRKLKVPKSEFVTTFKSSVFNLLDSNRYRLSSPEALDDLQRKIEELTLNFSEECIYKSCPNLIEMLTKKTDMPSAKEFLRGKYLMDKEYPGRMTIYAQSRSGDRLETGASELSASEIKKLRSVLSDSDKLLLVELGEHSIECLLVHTLGLLFNIENSVNVASLIDRIESNVRHYASFLCYKSGKLPKDEEDEAGVGTKAKTKAYPFGTALVEFLVSRNLLRLVTYNTDLINVSDSSAGVFPKTVSKKGKNYYRSSLVYAECLFNPALLPIKLNLPMVSPPKDWVHRVHPEQEDRWWLNVTDIYGGYLSSPTGQIYTSQRCMSSPDAKNFFVYFGPTKDPKSHSKLQMFCTTINSLQRQAFKVNSTLLRCIIKHRPLFEESGYLMPEFLSQVILPHASEILRRHFTTNKEIQGKYKYSEVYALLMKNMQRARYECTILDLAKAYSGYSLYFPAFIDFRGRIYRCGIFHFHERDLARSLLLLDCKDKNEKSHDKFLNLYLTATGFLYQSYTNVAKASFEAAQNLADLYDQHRCNIEEDADFIKSLVSHSVKAKRPFQYFSNCFLFYVSFTEKDRASDSEKDRDSDSEKDRDSDSEKDRDSDSEKYRVSELLKSVPVTQDASASAYQLMAYFLLDKTFAVQTNLFETNGEIFDIYSHIRIEFIDFLKKHLHEENPQLCAILDRVLTRKIVKSIYMPIIYGKTVNSTTKDLIECLSQDVLPKECSKLAVLCFQFWKEKYSYMDAFIDLICLVGRVCSSLERPVLYCAEYFSTSQDYKKMVKHSVRVFNSSTKKAHNVTLTVPSDVRDKRKSRTSTFVNFIHQKDAQIAMSMAYKASWYDIPLYTVHDNFITNTYNSCEMATLYLDVIRNMGPPLKMINRFLYINIIEPALTNDRDFPLEYFDDKIIPEPILNKFLYKGGIPPSEVSNAAGWKKIIEQLKQRYILYCKAVCGPEMSFAAHKSKWNKFQESLQGQNCIHY